MGLLRSLARKVRDTMKSAKDEAAHPGRPPTFKASTNPYVTEPEERVAHQQALRSAADRTPKPESAKQAASTPPPEAAPSPGADADDTPWYLQNPETSGWDATNPGTEPNRKNLT